ncbi:hypothetical protein [Macrococcus animalis]|uniref:hypothetical protein n=1 Tax=Macrococcus animalis TaxID=3395467 RepID=UPI0039BDB2D0
MALLLDKDPNTGLELNGLYYRIDKINFNDTQFQVVVTGYASEQAYQDDISQPIAQPRAYTWDYSKEDLVTSGLNIFEYAYALLKQLDEFKGAVDHV